MGKFGDFLLQAGQSIVGGALGLALGSANDKRQLKQQQALNDQQYKLQTQLTDYNQLKQMQMWRETNYKPQMEQLKLAGLNPALIYGMSGGGGASTNIAQGNITAPHAPTGGGEAIAMAQTAAQLGLMRAQRENIEADTKLKEATATKTSGVDTEKAATEIQSLTQGIQNQKAQQTLTEAETKLKQLDAQYLTGTMEDRIQQIKDTMYKTEAEVGILQQQNYVDTNTANDKIKLIRTQAIGAALQNALTAEQTKEVQSKIALNSAQIQKWAAEIEQGWTTLDIKAKEMKINAIIAEVNQMYTGFKTAMGNITIVKHDPASIAKQIDIIAGTRKEDFK